MRNPANKQTNKQTNRHTKVIAISRFSRDNKRKNNNNNTIPQIQQSKIDNTIHEKPLIKSDLENKLENETCHRHLIIGRSGCGKTYLINYILLQKQDPSFIITKSLNQYPNIKAEASDAFQHLENCENSTVNFDDVAIKTRKQYCSIFYKRTS